MACWLWIAVVVVVPVLGIDAEPPVYDIDLDQPPETRWRHAIIPNIPALQSIHREMLQDLTPSQVHFFSLFLKATFLDADIKAELQSVADLAKVPMDSMVVLSFFYELNAYCTSIVVRGEDGTMIHARNLDYPVPAVMRNLVANVNFMRGGKLLYKATTFIGYFGLLTAVKPGAFAVSLDQRNANGDLLWNVLSAAVGNVGNTIAIRRAMESKSTYSELVDYLSSEMLVTESYYIVSGSGAEEAAIITRLRNAPADVLPISPSKWYLVETNYDHWRSDPSTDPRLTHAVKHLEKFGKGKVGPDELWKVLSTRPVFQDRTIYTTIMIAKSGELRSVIRNVKPHEEYY